LVKDTNRQETGPIIGYCIFEIIMKAFFISLLIIFVQPLIINAQKNNENYITKSDSNQLIIFWKDFKRSIDNKDKNMLATLFKFPFYCHQCLDYLQPTDTVKETVLVTKKLFLYSIYKLFYNIPKRNSYNKKLWNKKFNFYPVWNDKKRRDGYEFGYAIVEPSKEWEGAQGFIYIKKIKGRYVIEGLDTIP
jgi:hypothetical protein